MGKYAIVTGGAGFVGSVLSKRLISEGYNVTICDDLSNGKYENIPSEAEFHKLDISDNTGFNSIPQHPYKIIFHVAAQASNALSWKDPINDLMVNQLGTYNILNFCKKRNINRVILCSSMSAYGMPTILPTPESIEMKPDTFYAVHKLASEHYLRIFAKEHNITYTIFRLYTTYGHGQNLDNINQGLLSIYLGYIVNQKPLIIKGSKDRTRDIIHVNDVVEAIILSLSKDISFNKTYNLGSGQYLTIEEIIELLITGMGYNSGEYPVKYEDNTQGDPFDTLADISAVMQDLDWKPTISPHEGIRMTLEAFK
jgi:UDP-glucose 4-epimerase